MRARQQLGLCLILGMALSLIDRTDVNWDLQNYHLYDPWALLHGRLWADYYAAGYQSYFNPLADLPYFILKCQLAPGAPRLVALLAGLPYGVLVFCTLRLAACFVTGRGASFFAAAFGLTGTATLSEIGTSYNDILVADFVLAALLCLLAEGRRRAFTAGLLCGFGTALKLTAGLAAPPLALFLLALPGAKRGQRLLLLGLGALAGFLLAYGGWGWLLWQRFGNPFYPMFGGLFPSPWAMPITGQDPRFFPRTTLQWLAYPFFWLQGKAFIAAELKLRDPRFALAYLAALAALASFWRRRPSRQNLALWLFIISFYLLWLRGFSILRYAIPLEALSGIFIATVLRTFCPRRAMALPLALLTLFGLGFSKPMGWGRIGYGKVLVAAPVPALPPGAVLVVAGAPIGFILPYLAPAPAHIIRLEDVPPKNPEASAFRALLATRPPLLLLTNLPAGAPALARFGLALGPCHPVPNAVQNTIKLCRLTTAPAP